jgi:hypothetical protein
LAEYRRHLAARFQPFFDSARRIILTSGYVMALAVSGLLACHVAGWTASRCLRLRTAGGATGPQRLGFLSSSVSTSASLASNNEFGRLHSTPNQHQSARPPSTRNHVGLSRTIDTASVQTFVPRHGAIDELVNDKLTCGGGVVVDEDDVSDYDNADVVRFDVSSPMEGTLTRNLMASSNRDKDTLTTSSAHDQRQSVTLSPLRAITDTFRAGGDTLGSNDFKYSETNV